MELNRRDFLKVALATGATTMAAGGLIGCSPAQEGGQADAPEAQESIAAVETREAQVVICGAGLAGLSAAVQAGQNGLKTILIERNPNVGGNGVGVEGIFAVDSAGQKEQGIVIDRGALVRHEIEFAQYLPSGALWNDLVDSSAANYDWLVENGVTFSGLINDYGGLYPTMHWFEGGNAGTGYVPAMKAAAERAGVEIICEMTAKKLITDEAGKVCGVYALNADDEYVQFDADAVIMATGGFGSNVEMISAAGWRTENMLLIGAPGHDGDGINMSVEVGGVSKIDESCALCGTRIDGMDPKSSTTMALTFGGPFLWVDQDGRRCVNEDVAGSNMMNVAIPMQVNKEVWCVASEPIITAALAGFSNAAAQGGTEDTMVELAAAVESCVSDNIFKCDTIEELATSAGIDAANLKASVERYNEMCAAGVDTQFGKDASLLVPLDSAPYYIYRLDTAFQVAIGGIDTNFDMQVVDAQGDPIEGLYAIGVDGVRLYRNVYPINVGATCCGNNIHSGRVAANHIAGILG